MSMAWSAEYTAGLSRFGLLRLRGEVHALLGKTVPGRKDRMLGGRDR